MTDKQSSNTATMRRAGTKRLSPWPRACVGTRSAFRNLHARINNKINEQIDNKIIKEINEMRDTEAEIERAEAKQAKQERRAMLAMRAMRAIERVTDGTGPSAREMTAYAKMENYVNMFRNTNDIGEKNEIERLLFAKLDKSAEKYNISIIGLFIYGMNQRGFNIDELNHLKDIGFRAYDDEHDRDAQHEQRMNIIGC